MSGVWPSHPDLTWLAEHVQFRGRLKHRAPRLGREILVVAGRLETLQPTLDVGESSGDVQAAFIPGPSTHVMTREEPLAVEMMATTIKQHSRSQL